MEIKVSCDCGQRYAFEVMPINGLVPGGVACPRCGIDGTSAANQIVASQLAATAATVPVLLQAKLLSPWPAAGASPAAASIAPAMAMPAAAPAAVSVPEATPPPPPAPGKLSINRTVHAAPASAPAGSASALPTPPPLAKPQISAAAVRAATPTRTESEFNIGLGILGAFVGAVLSSAILIGLNKLMGFSFVFSLLLIGICTGWGARIMYKGTDSTLGFFSAGVALFFVVPTALYLFSVGIIFAVVTIIFTVGIAFNVASG